jgi:hypothetical protein
LIAHRPDGSALAVFGVVYAVNPPKTTADPLFLPTRQRRGNPYQRVLVETTTRLRASGLSLTVTKDIPISVDASEHRATVASRAGVLSAALDAAVSTNAANSIEKMLSHQLAAAHMAGMDLLGRVEQASNLPPVERARLTNAAARLFEAFQAGCLTLQKLKTVGRRNVARSDDRAAAPGARAGAARLAPHRGRRPTESDAGEDARGPQCRPSRRRRESDI